jgi:hypothetical protein
MDYLRNLRSKASGIIRKGPTAGDEPQQQPTQVLETMSSSKYETALIKRSLEGFKTDYSQPPLDAYIPKDDKNARKRLPAKNKHKTISVYSILKHAIGLDAHHHATDHQRAAELAATPRRDARVLVPADQG